MCINFSLLYFPGEWRRAYHGPRIIICISKNQNPQQTQDCSDLETIYQSLCGLLKNITFKPSNVSATFSIWVGFWHKITSLQGSAGRCLHKHHFSCIQKIRYMKTASLEVFFFILWQLANHKRQRSQKQAGNLYTQKQVAKWSPHAESTSSRTWDEESPRLCSCSVFPTDHESVLLSTFISFGEMTSTRYTFLWRVWYFLCWEVPLQFQVRAPRRRERIFKMATHHICPLFMVLSSWKNKVRPLVNVCLKLGQWHSLRFFVTQFRWEWKKNCIDYNIWINWVYENDYYFFLM